jgi:hypothetical protein
MAIVYRVVFKHLTRRGSLPWRERALFLSIAALGALVLVCALYVAASWLGHQMGLWKPSPPIEVFYEESDSESPPP